MASFQYLFRANDQAVNHCFQRHSDAYKTAKRLNAKAAVLTLSFIKELLSSLIVQFQVNPHSKILAMSTKVTPFQERVYALLQQIPSGKVTTYAAIAKALDSSPRAVGGALRVNPFAPEIPCHRCIASTGYLGGFKGDWEKAPSGQNQQSKLQLLKDEGVLFSADGMILDESCKWDEFKA